MRNRPPGQNAWRVRKRFQRLRDSSRTGLHANLDKREVYLI
ncbi:hypothetical protein ACFL3A_04800 [Pseudomonadota bacterium]